jgi:carbonic anhydrase
MSVLMRQMWQIAAVGLGLALVSAGCSGGEDGAAAADALHADERIDQLETQVGDLQAIVEEHLALSGDVAPDGGPAADGALPDGGPEATTEDHAADAADDADDAEGSSTTDGHAATTADPAAHASTTPHWTYAGEAGAEHWGDLDPGFETCATGTHQSPIDLGSANGAPLTDLDFQWHAATAVVVNNGHTVQVDLTGGGDLVLDGHPYHLAQFHVHAPSEHTVNGRSFPLEIHFVHKDDGGQLAVVGVLVDTGAAAEALAPVLAVHPEPGGAAVPVTGMFDPTALLPLAPLRIAYRYDGSLTTPPCSEGVAWSVLFGSITVSPEQLAAITSQLAEANNRPVQPLDGRTIQLDTSIG